MNWKIHYISQIFVKLLQHFFPHCIVNVSFSIQQQMHLWNLIFPWKRKTEKDIKFKLKRISN